MELKSYFTGIYDVNTYLIFDKVSKEAAVIDLGGQSEELLQDIEKNGLNVKYLLNTHGHFDHISGEIYFQQHKMLPTYIHKNDEELVNSLEIILSYMGAPVHKPPKITNYLDENTQLSIGGEKIKVIETPGHTKGSVCFLIGETLFSGDTLFYESVGRTDFPGGSFEAIKNSVKNKLFKLPENTVVFPGHGDKTTIKHEKLNNSFVI